MPTLTSICYAGKLVHEACLDVLFNRTVVMTVIIAGPPLTPLPFLADPATYAQKHGAPVLAGADVGTEQLIDLVSQADMGLSLGYSRILRKREIDAPRLGTFNLHPSALPHYRGRHPDLYAIMDGQTRVGITLHRMDPGIDMGPIIAQASETVSPDETIATLTDRLYDRGAGLLEEFLDRLTSNELIPEQPQPKSVDPLELRRVINWHDSAWRINNLVRALTYPWPMAQTFLGGKPLLVSKVRVVEDGLIHPGYISEILDDAIRVGTGGHSIDILELRDLTRSIISIDQFASEFKPVPGETRFDDSTQ